MELIVNGRALSLAEGAKVADLLAALGVRPDALAVERNREIVRRRDFETTSLREGDVVEVVTFVGGG
jgi:thiamine biosynthesis protein ThiS